MERRDFLGVLASAAAALGFTRATVPAHASAEAVSSSSGIRPKVYWMRDVPRDSTMFEHSMSFVDVLQLTRSVASTPHCQYPKPIGVMVGRNVYPLLSRLHNFTLERDPSDIYFDPNGVESSGGRTLKVGQLFIHLPWPVFVDLDCGPDEFRVSFATSRSADFSTMQVDVVHGAVLRYDEVCALLGTDHPRSFGTLPA